MALSFRHLTLRALSFVTLAAIVVAPSLRAQPAPLPPPAFQIHALLPLGDLFYDLHGRRLSLYAGPGNFSSPAVVPAGGTLALYRLQRAAEPGLPPVRVPVVSTTLPAAPGSQTLLVIYPEGPAPADGAPDTRPLATLTFDQSPESFPAGTIRVFSFSTRPVALKIGAEAVPVPPRQTVSVAYPADQRTWLHVATVGEQGWQRVIGTPQTLGPRTRLSLFFRDIPPSLNDPKPIGLLLGKILESVPAPAASR